MAGFLDKAVTSHSGWKIRFRSALDSGDKVDAAQVTSPDECDLGKWLAGEGKSHKGLTEFGQLATKHAKFHAAAGKLAKLVNAGDKTQALAELSSGEFARASTDVVLAIGALRDKIR